MTENLRVEGDHNTIIIQSNVNCLEIIGSRNFIDVNLAIKNSVNTLMEFWII